MSQRKRSHQQTINTNTSNANRVTTPIEDEVDALSASTALTATSASSNTATEQLHSQEPKKKKQRRTKKQSKKKKVAGEPDVTTFQASVDGDIEMHENMAAAPTSLAVAPSSTLFTVSVFSSSRSTLTFDRVMVDECMLLMLQFTSFQDRIDQITVSKSWRSATQLPSTWRNDTLEYKYLMAPSDWLIHAIGGLQIESLQLIESRPTFSRFTQFTHLRRLSIMRTYREWDDFPERPTIEELRSAFQQLRLQEFEINTYLPNLIWFALFEQVNEAKNEKKFEITNQPRMIDDHTMYFAFKDEVTSQQPAIWSWCDSLVKLTVQSEENVASTFRTLAARVWSRLESLIWSLDNTSDTKESDMRELQQFLTPHCLPAITSLECDIDVGLVHSGHLSLPSSSIVNALKVNLPTLTAFRGDVIIDEPIALELASSSLTQLELGFVNESCQLHRLTQLRELEIRESNGLQWSGSWLSFFECIGSHVMLHLEKLIIPSTIYTKHANQFLTLDEVKRLSVILSQMNRLTSIRFWLNSSDSYNSIDEIIQQSHLIEYIHMLPSLTQLSLMRDMSEYNGPPEQQVRNLLKRAITHSSSLQLLEVEEYDILTMHDWHRIAKEWSGLNDAQIECYQLKIGQLIIPLSVNHRALTRTNAIHTLDLRFPYNRTSAAIYCPGCDRVHSNDDKEEDEVDDADLKLMILHLASLTHLTSLTISRLHDRPRNHVREGLSPDFSYLVQLIQLEQLEQLYVWDEYYYFTDQLFAHWTQSGHFTHLSEISLIGAPTSSDSPKTVKSKSVHSLLRLPQLRRIEFLSFPQSKRIANAMTRIIQAANDAGRKPSCRIQFDDAYDSQPQKEEKVNKCFYISDDE